MPRPISPELYAKIDRILFEDWDPIGVSDVAPEDEYRGYLPRVAMMLSEPCSEEELARYLEWARVEWMGLRARPAEDLAIARRLLEVVAK